MFSPNLKRKIDDFLKTTTKNPSTQRCAFQINFNSTDEIIQTYAKKLKSERIETINISGKSIFVGLKNHGYTKGSFETRFSLKRNFIEILPFKKKLLKLCFPETDPKKIKYSGKQFFAFKIQFELTVIEDSIETYAQKIYDANNIIEKIKIQENNIFIKMNGHGQTHGSFKSKLYNTNFIIVPISRQEFHEIPDEKCANIYFREKMALEKFDLFKVDVKLETNILDFVKHVFKLSKTFQIIKTKGNLIFFELNNKQTLKAFRRKFDKTSDIQNIISISQSIPSNECDHVFERAKPTSGQCLHKKHKKTQKRYIGSNKYFAYEIKFCDNRTQTDLVKYANDVWNLNTRIEILKIVKQSLFVALFESQTQNSFKMTLPFLTNENVIQIIPSQKLYVRNIIETEQSYLLERDIIIKQPDEKLNHIIIFAGGRYLYKPVVDYVLKSIIDGLKAHSKKRCHAFDVEIGKKKLLNAFLKIKPDFKCGCGRPSCDKDLQLFGDDGISPDRKYDNLGYIDEKQIITFVIKPHNTFYKFDGEPKEMKWCRSWVKVVSGHMFDSTNDRIKKLREKKTHLSKLEKREILFYDYLRSKAHWNRKFFIQRILKKKKNQKGLCYKCGTKLYCGDKNGISRIWNIGNKGSADRIDNNLIFYDTDNFNLVCVSCNFCENPFIRTHITNKAKNNPIPLTAELLEECMAWLQKSI